MSNWNPKVVDELKFHVQKVFPAVYDDSLSYFELLSKVLAKLNELIKQSNEYFSQDLMLVVREILDSWIENGTMEELINEMIVKEKPNFKDDNTTDLLLATFFRANFDTSVHMYKSVDGFNFEKISDKPILQGRDPAMYYENGCFYIAVTGYNPHDFVIHKSTNLEDWTSNNIDLGLYSPSTPRVWAPEWFKDTDGKLYVLLSQQYSEQLDIDGNMIPAFRPIIVECLDLETLSFGPTRIISIETGNKIDPYIVKRNEIYYMFIKDDYDKAIEIYQSPDLINWVKQTDNIGCFDGPVEGISVALKDGMYFVYGDMHAIGYTYVSQSVDLQAFSPSRPININYQNRHGSVMNIKDRDGKMIVNDYISGGVTKERNYLVGLQNISNNGVISELTPRHNEVFAGYASQNITIESIKNRFDIDRFYIVLRSASTGSITIKNNGDIEMNGDTTLSVTSGNADVLYEFVWVDDIGKFKITNMSVENLIKNPYIRDGVKRVNLNEVYTSGSTITNFNFENSAWYVARGNDQFTISGFNRIGLNGERVFFVVLSDDPTCKITLQNGSYLAVPNGSFEISVANGNAETIYELIKFPDTEAFRLKS